LVESEQRPGRGHVIGQGRRQLEQPALGMGDRDLAGVEMKLVRNARAGKTGIAVSGFPMVREMM